MPRTAGTGIAALVACGAIFAGTASAHQDSRERDVASSGVTEADPADVDPPALSDEQLDVVAASREAFGFDSDRALIASLVEDPDAWARSAGIGFPVTPEDAARLEHSSLSQLETPVVGDAARRAFGAAYAGHWLDFNAATIHAAHSPEATQAQLTEFADSTVDTPYPVELHRLEYPIERLDEIHARLVNDRIGQVLSTNESVITGGWVDIPNNEVVVVVDPLGDASAVEEELAELAGESVDVLSAIADDSSGEEGVVSGGHRLNEDDCSAGAYGYVNWSGLQIPFLATAGHCNNVAYHWSPVAPAYDPANDIWHQPKYNEVNEQNSGNADVQVMFRDDGVWEHTNVVEGWAGVHPNNWKITSVATAGSYFDTIGHVVCHSGNRSRGVGSCGTITSTNNTCNGHTGMRQVTYGSGTRDSGATVFGFFYGSFNVALAGLHEGNGCGGRKQYTFQDNARAAMNLSGWYTS